MLCRLNKRTELWSRQCFLLNRFFYPSIGLSQIIMISTDLPTPFDPPQLCILKGGLSQWAS